MENVYKTVTEHIHIECESFKSAQEQIAVLGNAKKIVIETHTFTVDIDEPVEGGPSTEQMTSWYIDAVSEQQNETE